MQYHQQRNIQQITREMLNILKYKCNQQFITSHAKYENDFAAHDL